MFAPRSISSSIAPRRRGPARPYARHEDLAPPRAAATGAGEGQREKPSDAPRGAQHTRRRVLEAAAQVFAELGFHTATKERIGAAAGFSHQTVRDYFRSKEGLLAAIAAAAWQPVVAALAAPERAAAPPVEALLAGYDALAALVRERRDEARCALHEAQLAGPRGEPLRLDEERALEDALRGLVRRAAPALDAGAVEARTAQLTAALVGPARARALAPASAPSVDEGAAREAFRAAATALLRASA